MNRLRAVLLLCLLTASPAAQAQSDNAPALAARRAAMMLDQAALDLKEADSAGDRVEALTTTIRAYEEGLAALREGLRRAAIRERAIRLDLESRQEEVARLLGVLETMQRAPETLLLLHPSGPVGTARAGMMLGEVAPAIQARAEELRANLSEVALLRALQESAEDTLAEGLAGVQSARTALSQAISDRTQLPGRFSSDPDALRKILQSTDTLEGFASALTAAPVSTGAIAGIETRKGNLPLPVQGTLLRGFNTADAAGIKRPGWLIATRPLALVTTPAPGTIRYRGPLLDYGNVIILELQPGTLLVLAGLAQVYGNDGEVLPEGAPVGLMGGMDPKLGTFLADTAQGSGAERPETLYMEIRQGNAPVNPETWFGVKKE